MDGSSKRLADFITPKKKLKVDLGLSNLAFYFPVVIFGLETSFDDLWHQLRDRTLTLSQVVVSLGSSFGSSIATTTGDMQDVKVEVGLI